MKEFKQPIDYSEYGKIPPQAIDLEEAVLGAILLENEAFDEISSILKPESFYKDIHKTIYKVCHDLNLNSNPIDLLTVKRQLEKIGILDEIGGAHYLNSLTINIGSAANITFHARILQQKFIQREMIRISSEIKNKAFDESTDVSDLLDFAESELFKITQNSIEKEPLHILEITKDTINIIEEKSKIKGLKGIDTGSQKLNILTGGWQKCDLIILAARPSMGKTAKAIDFILKCNEPCAFFSLEMSSNQLCERMLSSQTGIPLNILKNSNLSDIDYQRLDKNLTKLINLNIFIDDTPALNLMQIRRKIRNLIKKHGVKLIIIDYLQLMSSIDKKINREAEISEISHGLKSTAKEFDIPIIVLSQLNRNIENRTIKRPLLSDLRESGAIEQDADIVIFLHRPEKYGFTEDKYGNSLINLVEIIIAKHRNGAIDNIIQYVNDQSLTQWSDGCLENRDFLWKSYNDVF